MYIECWPHLAVCHLSNTCARDQTAANKALDIPQTGTCGCSGMSTKMAPTITAINSKPIVATCQACGQACWEHTWSPHTVVLPHAAQLLGNAYLRPESVYGLTCQLSTCSLHGWFGTGCLQSNIHTHDVEYAKLAMPLASLSSN